MHKFFWSFLAFLFVAVALSSCVGNQSAAPSAPVANPRIGAPATAADIPAVPAATTPITAAVLLVPTNTPLTEPALEVTQEATPAEIAAVDWLSTVTVEGDYYILGNPDAAVRLIDYSDFL